MKEQMARLGSLTVSLVLLSLSLFFLTQRAAYAYLDPGSGSLMLQFAIGGGLAFLFTLKMFWRRVRAFFSHVVLRRRSAGE